MKRTEKNVEMTMRILRRTALLVVAVVVAGLSLGRLYTRAICDECHYATLYLHLYVSHVLIDVSHRHTIDKQSGRLHNDFLSPGIDRRRV